MRYREKGLVTAMRGALLCSGLHRPGRVRWWRWWRQRPVRSDIAPPPPARRLRRRRRRRPWSSAPNPAYSQHLALTNTAAAHQAGITGAGRAHRRGRQRRDAQPPGVVAARGGQPQLRLFAAQQPGRRRCRRTWHRGVADRGGHAVRCMAGRHRARRADRLGAHPVTTRHPDDDGIRSGQRGRWRAWTARDPPGPDQPRRAGHEQLVGRPVLDQSGRDRADRRRVPSLHHQQQRPGGVRHRQRSRCPTRRAWRALPSQPGSNGTFPGGRPGARLARGHRGQSEQRCSST